MLSVYLVINRVLRAGVVTAPAIPDGERDSSLLSTDLTAVDVQVVQKR